jgi:glycosyltransferase 2 family protein
MFHPERLRALYRYSQIMRLKWLPMLGVAATLLGLYLLVRIFRNHDFAAILDAAGSVPFTDLLLALFFTAASFTCISAIELLGIVHCGRAVRIRRIIATAIAAIGIGHAIGLAALSSGAIRYRMYGRAGLDFVSTGKIVMFAGLTLMCGLATVGGAALLWQAETLAPLVDVSVTALRVVGAAALAVVTAYLLLCSYSPRRILPLWKNETIGVPRGKLAVAQVIMGSLNILCVGGVLYAALRSFVHVEYATVAALYVSSDITALTAHVPGGWGVLEYIVTRVLGEAPVLAGIVLYRAIYYLLPLGVGLLVFVSDELAGRRRIVQARNAETRQAGTMRGAV